MIAAYYQTSLDAFLDFSFTEKKKNKLAVIENSSLKISQLIIHHPSEGCSFLREDEKLFDSLKNVVDYVESHMEEWNQEVNDDKMKKAKLQYQSAQLKAWVKQHNTSFKQLFKKAISYENYAKWQLTLKICFSFPNDLQAFVSVRPRHKKLIIQFDHLTRHAELYKKFSKLLKGKVDLIFSCKSSKDPEHRSEFIEVQINKIFYQFQFEGKKILKDSDDALLSPNQCGENLKINVSNISVNTYEIKSLNKSLCTKV